MAGKEDKNQRAAREDGTIGRMKKALLGLYNRTWSNTPERRPQISYPILPPSPSSRPDNRGFSFDPQTHETGKGGVATTRPELNKPLPPTPDERDWIGRQRYLTELKLVGGSQSPGIRRLGDGSPTKASKNEGTLHNPQYGAKSHFSISTVGEDTASTRSSVVNMLSASPSSWRDSDLNVSQDMAAGVAPSIGDRRSDVTQSHQVAMAAVYGAKSHFSISTVGEDTASTRSSVVNTLSTSPSSWRDSDLNVSQDMAASVASSIGDRRSDVTQSHQVAMAAVSDAMPVRIVKGAKLIGITKAKAISSSSEKDAHSLRESAGRGGRRDGGEPELLQPLTYGGEGIRDASSALRRETITIAMRVPVGSTTVHSKASSAETLSREQSDRSRNRDDRGAGL